MEEYIVKDGRKLRLGYTTGTCAAAAAKAAAWMLLTGQRKEKIGIDTPKGIHLDLVVREITIGGNKVSCAIEKDSGDDPDITKGVLVFATVSLTGGPAIRIDGGKGVGRVTGKGLDQPVGAAAINSVPRQMIRENLEEVCETLDYQGGLDVVISVPGGEELAKKTFNPRLGIEGGISILGTTGIVDPMSDRALVETIRLELRQRRENGAEYVLLTPGNYGADFVKTELALPPSFAVLSSNFIGDSIDICGELGFRGFLLVGHIGKLVKLAGGMLNTHSKYGDCRMEIIAAQAGALGLPPSKIEEILGCVTCDGAVGVLAECGLERQTMDRIMERIGRTLARRAGELEAGAIAFSKEYGVLGETGNARGLLRRVREEAERNRE